MPDFARFARAASSSGRGGFCVKYTAVQKSQEPVVARRPRTSNNCKLTSTASADPTATDRAFCLSTYGLIFVSKKSEPIRKWTSTRLYTTNANAFAVAVFL